MAKRIKEIISKQLETDKEIKRMWKNLCEQNTGAIAKYVRELSESNEDIRDLIKVLLDDPNRGIGMGRRMIHFYEEEIRWKLMKKVGKQLKWNLGDQWKSKDTYEIEGRKFECDTAYFEVKGELLASEEKHGKSGRKKMIEKVGIEQIEPAEEKPKYAQMWSNKTKPDGELIDEERFKDFVEDRQGYRIFVVDRGEYEMGSVGEIYFNNKLLLKQEKSIGKQTKKEKDCLTPIEYRLLVYTLKNNYVAGNMVTLIEKCWNEQIKAKRLRVKLSKRGSQDKTEFMQETSSYRKTIANLSTFLKSEMGFEFRSYRTGLFRLTAKPSFCLMEMVV